MATPLDISEQEIRERCAVIISAATDEAARVHHNFIGTEHLFNALTKVEGGITQRLLIQAGFEPRHIRNEIRREAGAGEDNPEDELPFTPRAYRVLAMAVYHADDYGEENATDVHVLLALLQEGEGVPMRKLAALGISIPVWIELVFAEMARLEDASENGERVMRMMRDSAARDFASSSSGYERMTAATPLLDKYGRDLTELARQGKLGPAIGRDREIRSVARTLTRNKKNNPLLLGDAGVGKTAVIEGLAWTIVNGSAPGTLLGKRIVQIEIGTLLAGTSLRGQFEERLVGVVEEAKNTSGIILFIDEIHTIVGAGDTIDSNLDAANILKPALSRGEIVCIGATTHEEYRKAIAQDAALDRRFRIIDINEPSSDETLQILKTVQDNYARHHKVIIEEDALQSAVSLSTKYMINRRQPDKSLDLLDEACARVVIQTAHPDSAETQIVSAQSIAEVVAEWTGIPIAELTEDERFKFSRMDQELAAVVVGQDHAVRAVADAIKTNRAGLSDPNRPVAVFLFLGPSGVGKTELAKALSRFLFGSEEALLRFDMSEFHDEHTVARLIGSPPGYKDSQRGGQLTESLRRKPYSVVLMDEVEKAAPEVFDIFLQVFDDGRLSDARGGTVDARHAVWIMTSNIGTGDIGRGLGFGNNEATHFPDFLKELKKFFRPEFLNRLDEIVVFNELNEEALDKILEIQLSELVNRLQRRGFKLTLDRSARDLLLQQGYDPKNGARFMRRTIERLLIRPLSNRLLEQQYPHGTTINIRAENGALIFEALRPTSPMTPISIPPPAPPSTLPGQPTVQMPAIAPAVVASGHTQGMPSAAPSPRTTDSKPQPPPPVQPPDAPPGNGGGKAEG